jgi:protein-S-isoprenylcysteine O-methyltransferase Ste14
MVTLQVAAMITYLVCFAGLAVGAAVAGFQQVRPRVTSLFGLPGIAGTLLQGASFGTIGMWMGDEPLRPGGLASAASLLLAPLGLVLIVWAQCFSVPKQAATEEDLLVTGGAYRWLRHPLYLGYLFILLATGLLAGIGTKMLIAVAMYLTGTEVRIAYEEADLAGRFHDRYAAYRRTTWRYLPGIR